VRVRIRVPATCANLGPGFDILALAVDLCNEVVAESNESGTVVVDPGPDAEPSLHDAATNLIASSYNRRCEELGVGAQSRGVRLTCANTIPLRRGLGSSAAAIVSGVLAAERLHDEAGELTQQSTLKSATAIEGHPENVAAALLGGLVIYAADLAPRKIEIADDVACVLFVPEEESSTAAARAVVPDQFGREDAVFNAGRCALLARAFLTREYGDLAPAMEDRWHQPYRAQLMPAFDALVAQALASGAYGAALSGAGSSVIAFAGPADAETVAAEMSRAAETASCPGIAMVLRARNSGAEVVVDP